MTEICILLVDDEHDLVWAVQRSLSFAGYEVITAKDGLEALSVARRHPPDLIILDINMPGLDGLEVCRQLRLDPTLAPTPIIFLTERSAATDRVLGLDKGGDDYLVKPFDLQELKARIRALLRRNQKTSQEKSEATAENDKLVVGSLTLDLHARQARLGNKAVELTSTEFDLLYFLMAHPGIVYNSQQLLQHVWNYPPDSGEPGVVRWHMKNLRTKLEEDPAHPAYLRSVARQGYILERRESTG